MSDTLHKMSMDEFRRRKQSPYFSGVRAEITPKFNNPMTVYCKIQEYQNTNVLPGCKTYDFLHNPTYIQNGTLMSLPDWCASCSRDGTG